MYIAAYTSARDRDQKTSPWAPPSEVERVARDAARSAVIGALHSGRFVSSVNGVTAAEHYGAHWDFYHGRGRRSSETKTAPVTGRDR